MALTWVPVGTASAGHCEYCNEGLPTDVAIKTTEIGIDGVVVIVLEDFRDRVLDQKSWDIATVTVTDAMGVAVDGALESYPGFAARAWRPAAPWVPGTYQVTVDVDLPSFPAEPGPAGCPAFSRQTELVVVDEPRHVVGTQTLAVDETLGMTATRSIDTLVCCDGALPYETSLPGIGCPGYPSKGLETNGPCSELASIGWLRLDTEVLIDGQPAPPEYSLRELTRDGTSAWGGASMSMTITRPECLEFELLDLVTGELTLHPACHGDAVADQLGTAQLDPTAELAAMCSGDAYVCETIDGTFAAWDPTACTTWPDGAPYVHPATLPPDDEPPAADEMDGGCRVGTPSSPAAAWMLAWALLGLRRLRRRS